MIYGVASDDVTILSYVNSANAHTGVVVSHIATDFKKIYGSVFPALSILTFRGIIAVDGKGNATRVGVTMIDLKNFVFIRCDVLVKGVGDITSAAAKKTLNNFHCRYIDRRGGVGNFYRSRELGLLHY